jgi:hypothetical protein
LEGTVGRKLAGSSSGPIIFLHHWGKRHLDKLAAGFKAVLDERGKVKRKHICNTDHSPSVNMASQLLDSDGKRGTFGDESRRHFGANGVCVEVLASFFLNE